MSTVDDDEQYPTKCSSDDEDNAGKHVILLIIIHTSLFLTAELEVSIKCNATTLVLVYNYIREVGPSSRMP